MPALLIKTCTLRELSDLGPTHGRGHESTYVYLALGADDKLDGVLALLKVDDIERETLDLGRERAERVELPRAGVHGAALLGERRRERGAVCCGCQLRGKAQGSVSTDPMPVLQPVIKTTFLSLMLVAGCAGAHHKGGLATLHQKQGQA